MRRVLCLVLCLGLMAMLAGPFAVTAQSNSAQSNSAPSNTAQSNSAQTNEAEDRAAILAIMGRGPVGIGADFEAWERNFHPDWTVWFAGNEAARDRAPHMADVRDYVGSGNEVEDYQLEPVRLSLHGDHAIIDYNAVETIRRIDGGLRIVHYSGTDLLVREAGRWLILSTSISFPARYAQDESGE